MKLDLTDMLYALSFALDAVEKEAIGVKGEHGKRVAFLCYVMGKAAGFKKQELKDFVGCAILHDNALAEYLRESYSKEKVLSSELLRKIRENDEEETQCNEKERLIGHCEIGERRIKKLPFATDISNIILWHHENADGTGPMGLTEKETSFSSEILRLADRIDTLFDLRNITKEQYETICRFVQNMEGKWFSKRAAKLFLSCITYEKILMVKNEIELEAYLREHIESEIHDYSDEQIKKIAGFFAEIVDYKSSVTKKHSLGVASKAEYMAKYYGWSDEKVIKYYFAGALHDIGKLVVSNDILEKPAKLDEKEFLVMKDHAAATYYILSRIHGLEDVTQWAANHHEKLDGTGYSRRLTGDVLTFEDRLMACIDIYQALTEERPYKKGLSHEKAIDIMYDMADMGKIDKEITQQMDKIFSNM